MPLHDESNAGYARYYKLEYRDQSRNALLAKVRAAGYATRVKGNCHKDKLIPWMQRIDRGLMCYLNMKAEVVVGPLLGPRHRDRLVADR